MSYAIIEIGGKQIQVEAGRFYDVNLLHVEEEATHAINKVLLIKHEEEVTIGQPYVEGAVVEGKILKHWRGPKVIVYKMKPKKKTRKKRGHRQELTRFLIETIQLNGTVLSKAEPRQVQDEVVVEVSE